MSLFYANLTFDITIIADDYDRSINEAIKVTKYLLISFPSVFMFMCVLGLSYSFTGTVY